MRDEAGRKADGEAVEVDARGRRDAEGVTVAEAVAEAERRLAAAGVEAARVDAERLAEKALGVSRTELYLDPDRPLSTGESAELDRLLGRRARREPLAYVLGEWGFRRLTLKVDGRVLVPRPETEVVVQRCLDLLAGVPEPAVLDVGTGSGAIALAIADEHPGARVTAVDVSADALELARENARVTGLEVAFQLADVRDGLEGTYDLVVSNPPYVSGEEIEELQPEVRDWEPRIATVGEDHTAVIVDGATSVLVPGGHLVLEVADGRADEVARFLRDRGYDGVRTGRDLTGRDRVVEGRWSSAR
ncbi:MAG: peptide chain release factor N(5)-glutamine methyltransferase [Verrucomicrobiota bacterium]